MTSEKLAEILAAHKLYLAHEKGGRRADLSEADLSQAKLGGANLRGANLIGADLRWAKLRGANLSDADLSGANLSEADLSGADLTYANLSGANLSGAILGGADLRWAKLRGVDLSQAKLGGANLRGANLSEADLSGANLSEADLSGANLSGAMGLLPAVNFLESHFERTDVGYIAYKTFNVIYASPTKWEIKEGALISENVNFDRCTECGCGINVAPLDWVKSRYGNAPIWKVLIRWEWLCGVCVPYMSDGKIRCERVELLEVV